MQTEMRFRLLRKDSTSPSGYRIVGYQKWEDGIIYQRDTWFALGCNDTVRKDAYINHDAIELGIRVREGRGGWYYEGDVVQHDGYYDADKKYFESMEGVIIYGYYGWSVMQGRVWHDTVKVYDFFNLMDESNLRVIGNIHEKIVNKEQGVGDDPT